MAGFDLLPVGDSGSPIHLPDGETVLGRGPFFGVSDKRVSRHHGLLESRDGRLRIKPTHLNPCFCQSSLNEPPQPLDRDQWHTLKQGDILSLLPGKYMFKVLAVGGEGGTVRNSQGFQDEVHVKTSASPEPSEEPAHPVTPQGKIQTLHPQEQEPTLGATAGKETEERVNDPTQNQTMAVMEEEKEGVNEQKPEQPKKRVLPAWMMTATATPKSPSTPKAAGNRGRGASTPATTAKRAAPKRARATAPSSGEESGHSEAEQTPRKRVWKKKKSDGDGEAQSETARKATREVTVRRAKDSEESDNLDLEPEDDLQQMTGGATPAAEVSRSRSRVEPGDVEDSRPQSARGAERGGGNGVPGPAQSKARRRTPCPYGKSCYRKNPVHFQECSHPGESDYEEPQEEEDADRPECPYGSDCYRKNPLHLKEYSHSATRAKRSVRKNYKDDDEEDDDDLGDEDSFINDESEDIDEDSDYVPPDSDDSGKEDVKRLQKEAKAFTRRQK